jgi:GH24 family phage-related lysozyme (muramidase)
MQTKENENATKQEAVRRSVFEQDEENDNDKEGDETTEAKQDVKSMSTSDSGIDFIKSFEGFVATLYDDATNNATIGYGHLVHSGKMNGTDATETEEFKAGITEARGVELLKADVKSVAESSVQSNVTVQLTQNEFDALVAFTFNVGSSGFKTSTLLTRVNSGPSTADLIKAAFLMWNKGTVNGKKEEIKGLTTRRTAEAAIYNDNVYNNNN